MRCGGACLTILVVVLACVWAPQAANHSQGYWLAELVTAQNENTNLREQLAEAQAEAGKKGKRGLVRETEEENVKLRAELVDTQAKLRAALRENEALGAHLAAEDLEEQEVEANASQLGQLLDVAIENLKEAGVDAPLELTTPAPTVEIGNVTMPKIQFEDSILAGSFLVMGMCCVLPFLRPCRKCCETRLYRVFPFIAIFNVLLLSTTLHSLDMIEFNTVFFACVKFFEVVVEAVQQVLMLFAVVVGGFVFWKFKDRILESMGIEAGTFIVGDCRDWVTCWSMKRFRPIELFLWKVEGLPAAKLTTNNNVYCEVRLGYNVSSRTRVHHDAGHSCIFKESLQLNFDPYDSRSRLTLLIKHQTALGSDSIAQVQLGTTQVERLSEPHDRERVLGWGSTAAHTEGSSSLWAPSRFIQIDLVPAGRIFLRFAPAHGTGEEDVDGGSSCCCCCFGTGPERDQSQANRDPRTTQRLS